MPLERGQRHARRPADIPSPVAAQRRVSDGIRRRRQRYARGFGKRGDEGAREVAVAGRAVAELRLTFVRGDEQPFAVRAETDRQ
ncbi:MAG TPA: hypothetical protein DIT03_05120, partial [Candidatus Accumulibacter sp.]|nr:hypothetical protein [Accumulibacter sp.]HCN67648.1 hypothetical protein [Accumulibacter sp.]